MLDINEIHWPLDDLPSTCIYCMDENFYSKFYDVEEICSCGNAKWMISTQTMNILEKGKFLNLSRIQRCVTCKKIRISKIKKNFSDIIKMSNKCLASMINIFLKIKGSDYELLCTLKNMVSNFEKSINEKKINHMNHEKIQNIKKIIEDNEIDDDLIFEMEKNLHKEINFK